jgi:hypothetical protein
VWLLLITIVLVYTIWIEFYQFFHVINYYSGFNWIYDLDDKIWSLELDVRKTRTVNHYVFLLLILKFWHIVFIIGFWIFFLLRSLELGRIRYPLISANIQNFVILYMFAWVSMYPWLKFIFRRYLDMPYYWFFINNRKLGYRVFINDISLYYYSIVDSCNFILSNLNPFANYKFFYWGSNFSDDFSYSGKKLFIKNIILSSL